MFLLAGGALAPIVLIAMSAEALGAFAFPVASVVVAVGVACLIAGKWPQYRAGAWLSFGLRQLSAQGRHLYWAGYILIGCAVVLALFAMPFK